MPALVPIIPAMQVRHYVDLAVSGLRRELDDIRAASDQQSAAAVEALKEAVHEKESIASTYVTRSQYDERHDLLDQRMAELERWRANLTGRSAVFVVLGALIVAICAGLIVHFVTG